MQYININTPYGSPSSASPRFPSHLELGLPRSRSNSLDTEYRGSLDSKPELRTVKDLVPRHLRKSWRLLHQANTGTRPTTPMCWSSANLTSRTPSIVCSGTSS